MSCSVLMCQVSEKVEGIKPQHLPGFWGAVIEPHR